MKTYDILTATVSHLLLKCYSQNNKIRSIVDLTYSNNYVFGRLKLYYERNPEGIIGNNNVKVLWAYLIQCEYELENSKWEIVLPEEERI